MLRNQGLLRGIARSSLRYEAVAGVGSLADMPTLPPAVREYLSLSKSEAVVLLGGAIFTVLGFVQKPIPEWGWFVLAFVCTVWVQFRVYSRVRAERDALRRSPHEIAEIRMVLGERWRSGAAIVGELQGDLGATYGRGKTEVFLGTRGVQVSTWRAETRQEIERLLPGRVIEFDILQETPPVEYVNRERIRRGADEFNSMLTILEAEVEWLGEMRLLAGLPVGLG